MKKLVLTSIILTMSLSAGAQSWWKSNKIKGNGNVVTENRRISDYKAITLEGPIDVVLTSENKGSIEVKGEENIIPYVATEVKKDELKISYKKKHIHTNKGVTVFVPVKNIDEILLKGSGNITNENAFITTDNLSINLKGSGNIKIKDTSEKLICNIKGSGYIEIEGTSEKLTCNIKGSGNINAYDLKSHTVFATIKGSGDIKTTVDKNLKAVIRGSGNIYYKGNPRKTNIKSAGSGEIIHKD